ncbi:MAG: PA0069 family radical SAM protein [Gammaproteobacteria bacterium]|nr:PA0069 family radical SAM protein [Gammaproteobacteria bacterium]
MSKRPPLPPRGRGALSNPDNRYSQFSSEWIDDGWGSLEQLETKIPTTLHVDASRSVISYNQSPDIPFDRSINPYRGCEHGCVYCFARPTHAYLGLSPGLDFETQLFYKPDAATLLRKELSARNYTPAPIALGINTDAYQPAEKKLRITREILEVLAECQHPVTIVTKSSLIERDMDILEALAAKNLASIAVSITTLDAALARTLEPRAASPQRRMETIRRLTAAGIPVTTLIAPLIPVLTDHELENILTEIRSAGAVDAGYVLLRLPHELKELFRDWLAQHAPLKAEHVMNRLRDCRGGSDYQAEFGIRMRGRGIFADLIAQRFHKAFKRLEFPGSEPLRSDLFRRPNPTPQLDLF